MIKAKSIYGPAEKDDGIRVLVTRYWPRGIKKEQKDYWFKELGTEPDLIKLWKGGGITWDKFKKSYKDEFKSENKKKFLKELKGIVKGAGGKNVTLLCACGEKDPCHRDILKEMLER